MSPSPVPDEESARAEPSPGSNGLPPSRPVFPLAAVLVLVGSWFGSLLAAGWYLPLVQDRKSGAPRLPRAC